MDDYKVKFEIRIDWSEIDLFGHINNLAIMKYVQAARVHYLELAGLMQMQAELKLGPILASASCQFRKPLFYPGMVTVYSKVEGVKKTSFQLRHLIKDDGNEIIAEALDVIVFYDFNTNLKEIIPADLKERLIDPV
jgi:acyl-CoA thioester hydrolase